MKAALQQYIDELESKPKAIFVGIRRTDPYAGKKKITQKKGELILIFIFF